MEHESQLRWERSFGRVAAAAAVVAAVLSVVYVALQASALRDAPDNDRGTLVEVDENASDLVTAAIAQAVGLLLLALVIFFLYRATKYRRPETPPVALQLGVLGPVVLAVATVLIQLELNDVAEEFLGSRARTERRADDLLDEREQIPGYVGLAGQLALAFALVMVNINAMRAGTLSRFLAIIGIFVGALFVLPLFGGPLIIEIFWLGALAAVFLGYWPGGRGPAWESGEAEVWPGYAQQRMAASEPEPEEEEIPERPASRKRKKRR